MYFQKNVIPFWVECPQIYTIAVALLVQNYSAWGVGCVFFNGHILQWWRSDKVDKEPVQAFSLTLHAKVIHGHSDKGSDLNHI